MLSATIRHLLTRLRWRERFLAVSWSAARALVVVFLLLVVACLIDWVIDLRRDTPRPLRIGLLAFQIVVWVAALLLTLRLLFRRVSDDELALRIEERVPELGHRLISAVQLNRNEAKTAGMSPALIQAVTRQAEDRAGEIAPSRVIGGERFRWAVLILMPVVLAAVGLYLFDRATCTALLARVFLADRAIPRSVELVTDDRLWASNEEGTLEILVQGDVSPSTLGEVLLEPEEGPSLRLSLEHLRDSDEGPIFVAKVPPGDISFRYHAWLKDGRLRTPAEVRYSPRPVVQSIVAWVDLPVEKLGKQSTGEPFTELQRGGDIVYRIEGSRARLDLEAQVPIAEAHIRIEGKSPRQEKIVLAEAGEKVTASFALRSSDTGYSVTLKGANGFLSNEPARRTIRRLPLEPPTVVLLPETFWREGDSGTPEDREVEGIPVLLGERCRLDYKGSDRYGLSHARLRYRVLPRPKEGDEPATAVDLDQFMPLPLGAGPKPREPISAKAREEFSTHFASYLGALPDSEGGGRFDFSSMGIPDGKGGLLKLEEGDRIQFYVEMYSKADPEGTPGRSAIREKEILKLPGYLSWLKKKDDLAERTRMLEVQQRTARPGESD